MVPRGVDPTLVQGHMHAALGEATRVIWSASPPFDGGAFDARPSSPPACAARLARLRRLAWLMDGTARLPGTRFRFGLNGAVGMAPGVGDALLALVSLYIVWEAHALGVPKPKLWRMLGNVAVEAAAGAVPVVGDLFDMAYRANLRNLAIVEEHFGLDPRHRR